MKGKLKSFTGDLIIMALAVMVGLAVSKYFIFRATVSGSSMEPTYYDGDICFALVQCNIERGDVVIIDTDDVEKHLIKRVIGLPGDTIRVENSHVYINDEVYNEDYIIYDEYPSINADKDILLGNNEYFVLGDNRPISRDSRYFGAVHRSEIRGVVKEENKLIHFLNSLFTRRV